MNGIFQNDIHVKAIEEWENATALNITKAQHKQLYQLAIFTILKRANHTLSNVTLKTINDRVLYQCTERFPVISSIQLHSFEMIFDEFNINANNYSEDEQIEALRYLLTEELRVLGRIAADILTAPLHQELLKVIWNDSEQS